MPTVNNVLRLITQGTGTVNAITATITPAIPADSQCMVIVRSTGANNSTSVTFQPNGWSAYPVKARGNNNIRVGDTGFANYEMIFVFNTTGSYWELLNPHTSVFDESVSYTDLAVVSAIDQEIIDRDNAIADSLASFKTDNFLDATSSIQSQLNAKVFPIDFGNITNWAIADSVTYYLGLSTSVGTTTDQISFVPLYQGTIVAILTEVFSAGTIGSNTEDGVLDLFYNGGAANYTIATDFKMGANRHFARNFTGLNIPISTGIGYLRFIAPSYVTNPSAIQLRVTLIIRP